MPYEWETPKDATAVPHLLGTFIIGFSTMELLMIVAAARLKDVDVSALMFASKRITADAKREILHRAVHHALDGARLLTAKITLTRIQALIRRRNDLLHGTYVYVHGEADVSLQVGRQGGFGEPMDETVTDEQLIADNDELKKVILDLGLLYAKVEQSPGNRPGISH